MVQKDDVAGGLPVSLKWKPFRDILGLYLKVHAVARYTRSVMAGGANIVEDRVPRDRDGVAGRSQSTDGVLRPSIPDEHSVMVANASAAVPRLQLRYRWQ